MISLQMKQQMNAAWADTLTMTYLQPFKDKYWLQQTIQVQRADRPAETRACIRDLDDSWRKALHDQASQTKTH